MDGMKLSRANLAGMSIGELRKLAGTFSPPIPVKPAWIKKKIVAEIIKREEREAMSPPQGAGPDDIGPVRPDFEQAAAEEPERVERRGGPRVAGPGKQVGRPLGMTDEKAAVKNLPKQPNMAIRHGVYVLGQAWATSVKIPAVAFDDEETDLIALPLSQLQEFYYPGLIPEIAAVWVSLTYGLARVVKVRIDLINEIRKQRNTVENTEKKDEVTNEEPK